MTSALRDAPTEGDTSQRLSALDDRLTSGLVGELTKVLDKRFKHVTETHDTIRNAMASLESKVDALAGAASMINTLEEYTVRGKETVSNIRLLIDNADKGIAKAQSTVDYVNTKSFRTHVSTA